MVSWVRGRCIGKGSFGTVNLAFNKQTGALFAVKSAIEANQVQALDNEIKILSSLSSPYIVKFLGDDVSFVNSTRCRNLHIEYLPGGTVIDLASSTHGSAGMDEKTLRSFTYCIVSALKYVHSRGIVHCDVKGRNILLGASSDSVKLADFGSAIDATSGKTNLPRGSPLWMAPEVVRREYQGPESDVWSLGCTFIEMITGKPAWEDRGVDSLSLIGFSDELPELPSKLSELARDFLTKCLKREPNQRWSCDQLLQHPFLASVNPNLLTNDLSPRCVLDGFNSDYEELDIDGMEIESSSCSFGNIEALARNKMRNLATSEGVNWETSESWVEVRRSPIKCERGEEEEQEPETSSVYSLDSVRMTGEEGGRVIWESRNSSCSEAHVDGSTSGGVCWCGEVCREDGGDLGFSCSSQKVELAVRCELLALVGIYYCYCRLCCHLLLYLLPYFMRIIRYYYFILYYVMVFFIVVLGFIWECVPAQLCFRLGFCVVFKYNLSGQTKLINDENEKITLITTQVCLSLNLNRVRLQMAGYITFT